MSSTSPSFRSSSLISDVLWDSRQSRHSSSLSKYGFDFSSGFSRSSETELKDSSFAIASERITVSLLPSSDGNSSSTAMADPSATIVSRCSGKIASSGLRFSLSQKAFMRVGLKLSGPPSKITGAFNSSPWASPPMVCFTMAWKEERAMSSLLTLWFKSPWMSVFANTPHRPEIEWTVFPLAASPSNSSTGTLSRDAISSMKAPVPPAQEPFILMSLVISCCCFSS